MMFLRPSSVCLVHLLALVGVTFCAPLPLLAQSPTPSNSKPATQTVSPTSVATARPLDPATFARASDSLGDTKPVNRMVARFAQSIAAVSVDIGAVHEGIAVRTEPSKIEFLNNEGKGAGTLLGRFHWQAMQLDWEWTRASLSLNSKALEALQRMLVTSTISVQFSDATREQMFAPPVEPRLFITPAVVVRFKAPVPPGHNAQLEVTPDATWSRISDESNPGVITLESAGGQMRISWLPESNECTMEWLVPEALEFVELRRRLAELRKEMGQRSKEERQIIEIEIASHEQQLRELTVTEKMLSAPCGTLPPILIKSEGSRVYARISLTTKKS